MKPRTAPLLTILIVLSVISLLLVAVVAALYSYDTLTQIESGGGFVLLLAITAGLWLYRRRTLLKENTSPVGRALLVGLVLGLCWAFEIGINNFLAPSLPGRDIIDNIFWAVIALAILALAIIQARPGGSFLNAVKTGAWCGFASGMVACAVALAMIVFGMGLLTRDPLNLAEWADHVAINTSPTMADYFAFETFAGAFGHLLVLGVVMGGLLGVVGGALVKGVQRAAHSRARLQPSRRHKK